jgi:hypothetical protein
VLHKGESPGDKTGAQFPDQNDEQRDRSARKRKQPKQNATLLNFGVDLDQLSGKLDEAAN